MSLWSYEPILGRRGDASGTLCQESPSRSWSMSGRIGKLTQSMGERFVVRFVWESRGSLGGSGAI